jgi:hypothetical protein
MQLSVKGGGACLRIPELSPIAKELLGALDVKLPLMLPKSTVEVDSKKKLASRRKFKFFQKVAFHWQGATKGNIRYIEKISSFQKFWLLIKCLFTYDA